MGERNFRFDSLKSGLNCDMKEKRIVLPKLSCRTAAEFPPSELLDAYKKMHISPKKACRPTDLKVFVCVAAPETQNNTPNPRKSVVFIICPL